MRWLIPLLLVGCVSYPDIEHGTTVTVTKVLPKNQVVAACKMGNVDGCATLLNGTCFIYAIDDWCVLRHEYKHCHGWVHRDNFNECK